MEEGVFEEIPGRRQQKWRQPSEKFATLKRRAGSRALMHRIDSFLRYSSHRLSYEGVSSRVNDPLRFEFHSTSSCFCLSLVTTSRES